MKYKLILSAFIWHTCDHRMRDPLICVLGFQYHPVQNISLQYPMLCYGIIGDHPWEILPF